MAPARMSAALVVSTPAVFSVPSSAVCAVVMSLALMAVTALKPVTKALVSVPAYFAISSSLSGVMLAVALALPVLVPWIS